MDLQLLDFECTEDSDGLVCWDALAQPLARHNSALLQEVSHVLAWAFRFDPQGPGSLEDGALWDFDLQATLHRDGQLPLTTRIEFNPATGQTTLTPPAQDLRIALSLSLSGAPGFVQAFRDHWGAP